MIYPARLTGIDRENIGVVLDFEEVRVALGLRRVAVDGSGFNDAAAVEYRRLNHATREFVKQARGLERRQPDEAIARYRYAVTKLLELRDLARASGLDIHGYALNSTDATPIDRLVRCLVKMDRLEEAKKELDSFVEGFPHAGEMKLLKDARRRLDARVTPVSPLA